MIRIKGEFGVFVLLVSSLLVSSRPHPDRSRRSIVKDYLNPLTYPTAVVKFEKGEDGKFQPHMIDSKVEYAPAHKVEDLNAVAEDAVAKSSVEKLPGVASKDPVGEVIESVNKGNSNPVEDIAEDGAKAFQGPLGTTGFARPVETGDFKGKSDERDLVNTKSRYSLVKQEDHNMQFPPPKPDGKDDPPPHEMQPEEEEKRQTVPDTFLGRVPFLPGMPLFLPEHGLSFGGVLPGLPPALGVQDRLPEVLEEGVETAVVENVDPVGGERRTLLARRFRQPFGRPGFTFPVVDMKKAVRVMEDGYALGGRSKAQIVDVMGKKMLLQKKMMAYPTDGDTRMYLGVMSVQLLEEADPEILRKLGIGKDAKGSQGTDRETEDKQEEDKTPREKLIPGFNVDEVPINLSDAMEGPVDAAATGEADELEVEESKLVGEKSEASDDAVVAKATGITSISKVTDSETKEVVEDSLKIDEKVKVVLDVMKEAASKTDEEVKEGLDVVKEAASKTDEEVKATLDIVKAATKNDEVVLDVDQDMMNEVASKADEWNKGDTKEPADFKNKKHQELGKEEENKKELGEEYAEEVEDKKELGEEDNDDEDEDKKELAKEGDEEVKDKKELGNEGDEEEEEDKKELGKESDEEVEYKKEIGKEGDEKVEYKEGVEKTLVKETKPAENETDDEADKVHTEEFLIKSKTEASDSLVGEEKAVDEAESKNMEVAKRDSNVDGIIEASLSVVDDVGKEKDSGSFEGTVDKKVLNVEDIDITKIDGVFFAERKKKNPEDPKDASKKKSRKCKCEEDSDADSDSEED